MDTLSILSAIKPYQRRNIFKGVYPCDSLPKKFSLPAIFVVNLSPHNEPGSHGVTIYISYMRNAFYFDSFGFPVNNYYISLFLKKNAIRIDYNAKQLQHISSNKCGHFCCAFAISILKNCTVSSFISKFCTNLYVNDITIQNMYNYFKKI